MHLNRIESRALALRPVETQLSGKTLLYICICVCVCNNKVEYWNKNNYQTGLLLSTRNCFGLQLSGISLYTYVIHPLNALLISYTLSPIIYVSHCSSSGNLRLNYNTILIININIIFKLLLISLSNTIHIQCEKSVWVCVARFAKKAR